MAKKHHKSRKKRGDLPGISLEKIVARIQQMMDPNSTVTHNETLTDRYGEPHKVDVAIHGKFGGRDMLGVVECKDHSRKKDRNAVSSFSKTAELLNAGAKLMVSRKGFTKRALKLAETEGVGCLSLLPNDPKQVGFSVGEFWYGTIRTWTDFRLVVVFTGSTAPISSFTCDSVKWNGIRVDNWFYREFILKHSERVDGEEVRLEVTFDQPRILEIEGAEYEVKGLAGIAKMVHQKKRKWISFSGDALYDWHTRTITIPPKGSVIGSMVDTNLFTWDDFIGDIPPAQFVQAHLTAIQTWNDTQDVPDLSSL